MKRVLVTGGAGFIGIASLQATKTAPAREPRIFLEDGLRETGRYFKDLLSGQK
jgi:nucleoside-diphosphate-sugar epimerase